MKVFLFFLSLALYAVGIPNFSSLAADKTSHTVERVVRDAWEAKDCKQAEQSLNEMRNRGFEAIYFFYKAEAYEFGYCTEQDIDNAIEAFQQAYAIKDTLGVARLASLFLQEKQDIEKARKWFRTLAFFYAREPDDDVNTPESVAEVIESVKEAHSQALLGSYPFPEEEFDKAIAWATKIFESSPKEILKYALIFETGANGYPVNSNASERLLHRAVMQKYPPAAWHYAQQLLKIREQGDKRYRHRLHKPLRIAGLGGILEAQIKYADLYLEYEEFSQAYSWYLFARKNGAQVDAEIEQIAKQLEPSKIQDLHRRIEVRDKKPY